MKQTSHLTTEQRLDRIEASLERLNTKLTKFMVKQNRPLWVRASVITSLTGWNNHKMRTARENGYIEFQEREHGGVRALWYNLNSLDSRFIKYPIDI